VDRGCDEEGRAVNNAEVLATIRKRHLKANISSFREEQLHWDRAWLDEGGTIFGPGPYAHVPVKMDDGGEIVIRVYPPAALLRRLQRLWEATS